MTGYAPNNNNNNNDDADGNYKTVPTSLSVEHGDGLVPLQSGHALDSVFLTREKNNNKGVMKNPPASTTARGGTATQKLQVLPKKRSIRRARAPPVELRRWEQHAVSRCPKA